MPSFSALPTPCSARVTYSMRRVSSSVPMPFSVTRIGVPSVTSHARRIVASSASGQNS